MRTNETKNKINEIKKWEEKSKWKDLIYKASKCNYDFQQFETIKNFGESTYTGKVNTDKAKMDQFIKKIGRDIDQKQEKLELKNNTYENVYSL